MSESLGNIVKLSDIRQEKLRASSPFGPVRAGLTTWPRTNEEVRLMELLNSLESVVESLNYKSYTAYATLATALEGVRATLYDTLTEEAGTENL